MPGGYKFVPLDADSTISPCWVSSGGKNFGTNLRCSLYCVWIFVWYDLISAPEEMDEEDGRLGGDSVVFDSSGSCGTVVIEADRLGVWVQSLYFYV